MITVPARRVKQFGVEFYQAGLSAKDIDRLVKFEVLGYSGGPRDETPKKNRSGVRSRVNWDMLEKRIAESETAYQRPVIRRKIDELVTYYKECKDAGTLPAIPGAVIITSEKRFTFTPVAGHHDLGLLQIPEEHGVLRVLDGQHRLLALHALSQGGETISIEVPAVLFDSLDARQIVELFVTINAKHTRLNPSHIISLAGRKLYPDPNQALAHDVIRSLNEDETSPLHGEIKMLGTGRGRVSQAPLAEEIVDFLETVEKLGSPPMKRLVLAVLVLGCAATVALAQGGAPRTPLPARVTAKLGMLNVPALSPLWLLPEYAAAYNIQIETVMFQRFADGRTALASGDLDITAFGPQDITLAVAQGARSLVGVAGVGSGNDCLLVRRGEDIRDWKELGTRKIGIGAGSISWLKFAASVQEHGVDYGKLRITNIVGGGANYLKALQGKEIDLAVVWQPFCAQGLVDGYAQYPTLDHNRSKAVGGLIAVLAVNRDFMEKHPDAVQRLVVAYLDVLKFAQANPQRWSMIYAEKAGLPEPVAAESIRITRLDATLRIRLGELEHVQVR